MCLPVEGDPGRFIVPGSIQDRCDDCGTEVWVAPSGKQVIRQRTTIVVCMNCALIRMNKEPVHLEVTKKQLREIEAWGKRN